MKMNWLAELKYFEIRNDNILRNFIFEFWCWVLSCSNFPKVTLWIKWGFELRTSCIQTRSNRLLMFFEIGVLKNFASFTGKHLCWSLFFNKAAGCRPATACNFIKKRLKHRCFHVNFPKLLRIEHLRWLHPSTHPVVTIWSLIKVGYDTAQHHNNVCSYLNISSIRNKLNNLKLTTDEYTGYPLCCRKQNLPKISFHFWCLTRFWIHLFGKNLQYLATNFSN